MLTWAEVRVVVVVVIKEVGSLPTKSSCSGETQAKMKEGGAAAMAMAQMGWKYSAKFRQSASVCHRVVVWRAPSE